MTKDEKEIQSIARMTIEELLLYVVEQPELLTDSYYKEFGNAIRARTQEIT